MGADKSLEEMQGKMEEKVVAHIAESDEHSDLDEDQLTEQRKTNVNILRMTEFEMEESNVELNSEQ
jgi:hypothetical protein